MITAREQATSVNNAQFKKYLAEIEKKIAGAINMGETKTTVYFGEMGGFLATITNHLQLLDFKVDSNIHGDCRNETTTTINISW
jgi:hypothetical protein